MESKQLSTPVINESTYVPHGFFFFCSSCLYTQRLHELQYAYISTLYHWFQQGLYIYIYQDGIYIYICIRHIYYIYVIYMTYIYHISYMTYISWYIYVWGSPRIPCWLRTRIRWLSEMSGHSAGGIVSQWGSAIKSPWVHTVTSWYKFPAAYWKE